MTNAENTVDLAEHRQHSRARLLRIAADVFDDVRPEQKEPPGDPGGSF